MEQVNHSLEQCKADFLSANDDISRFGIIFKISEILKSQPYSLQLKDIFGNLEISFLNKFLLEPPDGIAASVVKITILDILSHIYTLTDVSNEMICSFIKPLHSILDKNIFEMENEMLLFKAVNLLSIVVKNEKFCNEMLKDGCFLTLCKLYCHQSHGKEQYLTILKELLMVGDMEPNSSNQEAFDLLLANMSREFANEQSFRKFILCSQIHDVLLYCGDLELKLEARSKIVEGLTVLFKHRLTKGYRDDALKLGSLLVQKPSPLFLSDDPEISKVFFVAFVQLSCIEIRMILEDKSILEISNDVELLSACYINFEYAISTMTADGWYEVNRNYCSQLLFSIKLAMIEILRFLKKVESDLSSIEFCIYDNSNRPDIHPVMQVVIATIRVVCCWLADETFHLQDEVRKVLPFILNICKEWFRNVEEKKLDLLSDIDPMYFLIPPLCHLVADNKSREILLNNDLLPLLLKYFNTVWKQFKLCENKILPVIMIKLCQVFLNIIVLEPRLARDDDQIPPFCKIILSDLSGISTDAEEYLALRAYFVVLGLLITKHCHKKVIDREMSFYPFLIGSIKFLWDAHYVENRDMTLCLTRKYRREWDIVMELWFLGMETLRSLLRVMPWITSFIVESSWPNVIVDMLSNVSADGIEGNVKATYQALLIALVKSCSSVADIIVQKNGFFVSQKHNLVELEELLSDLTLNDAEFETRPVHT